MGIMGIPEPVLICQCSHAPKARAFWTTKNDGSEPPDLFYTDFPTKGRIVMSNQTIFLACWACRDGLDVIVQEYGKTLV